MGCRVISVTSSGRVHDSSIAMPVRTRWYSGRERPAWRMNQTGVYGTGFLRQARRKGGFAWGWFPRSILSYPIAASANRLGDTPGDIRRNRTPPCQDQDEPRHVRQLFRDFSDFSGPRSVGGHRDDAAAWELSRLWCRRAIRAGARGR